MPRKYKKRLATKCAPNLPRRRIVDQEGKTPRGTHLLADTHYDWRAIDRWRRSRERQYSHPKRRRRYDMMKKSFLAAEAAHLYLMGWMIAEIAKQLGVTKEYISKILDEEREKWMKRASEDSFAARSEELARIGALLREYSMAWVESKGKRTSRSVKYGPGESPTAEEAAGDAEVKQIVDGAILGSDEILAAAKSAGVDTSIAFGEPGANRGAMAEAARWRRLANLVATEVTVKTDGKRDGNPAFLAGIQWCIEMRVKILGLSAAQEIKLGGELRVAGATPNEVEQQMLGRLADRLRSMQLPAGN